MHQQIKQKIVEMVARWLEEWHGNCYGNCVDTAIAAVTTTTTFASSPLKLMLTWLLILAGNSTLNKFSEIRVAEFILKDGQKV